MPGSRGGSCCGRTRFRTTTVVRHPRDWSPTCLIISLLNTTSARKTYHGATLPRGGFPANSVSMRYVLSRMSRCCSIVMSTGFSWLYPCSPISWPASRTAAMSSGNDSRLCPGMNQVVLILYCLQLDGVCYELLAPLTFLNIFRSRCVPTVPAKIPRLMSLVLSSPPYDPSQPETASTSTP